MLDQVCFFRLTSASQCILKNAALAMEEMKKFTYPSLPYGCFQKIGYPKMDGENNGQPYFLMDDLGGKPTIFGSTSIYLLGGVFRWHVFGIQSYFPSFGVWMPRAKSSDKL